MSEQDKILRVACAQIDCVIGDPKANIAKHQDWIGRARKKGCDLLVFPELSLTGYGNWFNIMDVSRRADCIELRRLAESVGNMKTVVGFIEEGEGGLLYNSTAWLADGKVELVQRKLNLPTYGELSEGKFFAKGRSIDLINLNENWNVATLICADVWNPALVHVAAQNKATLLVTPIASTLEAVGNGFDNSAGWDLTSRFYSMIYGLPMVMCNWVGSSGSQTYWGGSRILDETGNVAAQGGNDEELLIADLDYQRLVQARFRLPTIRDADPDLVLRELQRSLLG
jgi:N-carbamoylputrescine amidase